MKNNGDVSEYNFEVPFDLLKSPYITVIKVLHDLIKIL